MTTVSQMPVSAAANTLSNQYLHETARAKARISASAGLAINTAVQEQIGEDLALAVESNDEKNNFSTDNAPAIRQPTTSVTNKANVLKLMAQYQSLTNELDSHELKNRLSGYIAAKQAKSNQMEKLSDELTELSDNVDVLTEDLKNSNVTTSDAQTKVETAKTKLDSARTNLDSLLKQLGVESVDDPAVANNQQVLSAVQTIKLAEAELKNVMANFQSLKESHIQLMQKANEALEKLSNKYDEIDKASDENIMYNFKTNSDNRKEVLTRTAIMIQLITEFINKIDESSETKLKKDLEINRKQLKARQAQMKKKSDEYEEKVRKAEELQKTLGCLGTALGIGLFVLGALTTFFGGAGLAVMAFGAALLIADTATELATGESLTGMAMNWVMENVVSPVAKIISKITESVMEAFGINKLLDVIGKAIGYDLSGMVKNVMSAVTTIATFLAMALIAKSLIKKLVKNVLSKIMSAIYKAITSALSKMASKISATFVKMASKGASALTKAAKAFVNKINEYAKKLSNFIFNPNNTKTPEMIKSLQQVITKRLEMATMAVGFTNTVVSSSLNIAIADVRLQASKSIAEFHLARTDYEILQKILSSFMSKFKNDQEDINSLNNVLSSSLESTAGVSKFIAHNIRT